MSNTLVNLTWGDVVEVEYPFSDLSQSKKRPAVFLGKTSYGDAFLTAITSKFEGLAPSLHLKDWEHVGLTRASAFKPHIMTITASYINRTIGHLSDHDGDVLARALKQWVLPYAA